MATNDLWNNQQQQNQNQYAGTGGLRASQQAQSYGASYGNVQQTGGYRGANPNQQGYTQNGQTTLPRGTPQNSTDMGWLGNTNKSQSAGVGWSPGGSGSYNGGYANQSTQLPPGWGVSQDSGGMTPNPNYGQQQGPPDYNGHTPTQVTDQTEIDRRNQAGWGPGGQQQSQPSYGGQQPLNSDYQNPDGSWHTNPNYGQNNSGGGHSAPSTYGGAPGYGSSGAGGGGQQMQPGTGPTGGGPNQAAQQGQGMASGVGGYNPGAAANYYNFLPVDYLSNKDNEKALQHTSQYQLPIMQFGQNAYQYGNDFAEQVRRFNLQQGMAQQGQDFQQNLSTQQQQLAQWQANTANNQFQQQFGQNQANDKWNQQFQQTGQQQQYGLQSNAQQYQQQNHEFDQAQQNAQFQQQFGLQQTGQQQQYGLQQNAAHLASLQNQQQYGLAQGQQALNTRNQSLQELANQQQFGLSNQQMAMAQQHQSQQYGLDTRGMSVQEQAQAAQAAYQSGQLGATNRGLSLQELQNTQQYGLAQSQQQIQQQQFADSLKQQQQAAYLQAYGHNQAVNPKWMKAT